MNFESRQMENMRGQCLLEMTLFVPLFFALIAGAIAFLTLISWKEASQQKALSLRYAVLVNPETQVMQGNQVFSVLEKLNNPKTELQQNQSLEITNARQGPSGHSLDICRQTLSNEQAIEAFCINPNASEMFAFPKQTFKLRSFSEDLNTAVEKSQGVRFDIAPVFDNSSYFSKQQREHWRSFVFHEEFTGRKSTQGMLGFDIRLQTQIFRTEIAQSGPEQNIAPWNLNRDCFYSSQGMECRGMHAPRASGPIQKLYLEQRRISSLTQASACAAEACARAPNPAACAASAMTSAAHLRLNATGEPAICPLTVAAAKMAHRAGKNFLASLTLQKTLATAKNQGKGWRQLVSGTSNASQILRPPD